MPTNQTLLYEAAAAIERIAQVHRAAAADVLRELGLGEAMAGLLWLLVDNAGCTMGEAAERLSCDRSNVTLLATQLEKRGLVQRTSDPQDARRRNLHLTQAGRTAATGLRDAITKGSPLVHLDLNDTARLVTLLRESVASWTSAEAPRVVGRPGRTPENAEMTGADSLKG